jgi:hypothetical protein
VIEYAWPLPHSTDVPPLGEIEPPVPAVPVTVYDSWVNVAVIVWAASTFVNV